jgi:hypothetical protein
VREATGCSVFVPLGELCSSEVETTRLGRMLRLHRWLDKRSCLGDLPAPGWRDGLTASSKAAAICQILGRFGHGQPHQMPRSGSRQCMRSASCSLCTLFLRYCGGAARLSGDQGKPQDPHDSDRSSVSHNATYHRCWIHISTVMASRSLGASASG